MILGGVLILERDIGCVGVLDVKVMVWGLCYMR